MLPIKNHSQLLTKSDLRAALYFDPNFSNSPITQSVIQGVPI